MVALVVVVVLKFRTSKASNAGVRISVANARAENDLWLENLSSFRFTLRDQFSMIGNQHSAAGTEIFKFFLRYFHQLKKLRTMS